MTTWGEKLKRFLWSDLWELDAAGMSRWRAFWVRQVQLLTLVGHDFVADRCLLRASALTYTTLLSIVPLLALMFAVLKGFGVQNALEPLIFDQFAVLSEDVVAQIIGYINNTNVGRLGTLGLALLLLSVLTLLSNIEKSFNAVWGVEETRPLMRRFADYFSVVTVGPLFALAAISMTSTLQSNAVVSHIQDLPYMGQVLPLLFKVIPYLGMWIAFTALYLFMPNTRVHLRAALVGGIFGGTLWQLAQWGYVHFQVGVAKYNAIYGTMAALPIFMVWVYLSWMIVLLGLEFTYAWQNLRLVPSRLRGEEVNYASRRSVALTLMVVVAEAYYQRGRCLDQEQLCSRFELPPRLVGHVLGQLLRLGFLAEVHDEKNDRSCYQPGMAPDALTVEALLQGLGQDGVLFERSAEDPVGEVVRQLEGRLEGAGRQALEGLTIRDLVMKVGEESGGKKEEQADLRG